MDSLDEICETFDEMEIPGDREILFVVDGMHYEVGAVQAHGDGPVVLVLEEAGPMASIHWGGDGV